MHLINESFCIYFCNIDYFFIVALLLELLNFHKMQNIRHFYIQSFETLQQSFTELLVDNK